MSLKSGRTLFVLVLSYTDTARIPGITVAGATPQDTIYTPPADAELIHYGHCISIPGLPMTPDGKPTPALLTRAALLHADIPYIVVDAGCVIPPRMPHIHTGIKPGKNIEAGPAMSHVDATHTIQSGEYMGRTLSSLCDNLIIGESIPGGTTTALALLRGLNLQYMVSSSMPDNPVQIKERVASAATSRLNMDTYMDVAVQTADPMILFVAGMLNSTSSNIILAGGTQMLAVLALATKMGHNTKNTMLATTTYVADDPDISFYRQAELFGVPIVSVRPHLENSKHAGIRAYTEGFAKEGAGAGGAIHAAQTIRGDKILPYIDREYDNILHKCG